MPWWASIAWRVAAGVAASWLGWRLQGTAGLLYGAPVFGFLLARALLDAASALRHALRAAAWRPVQGRHFAYHGVYVRVIEDERHHRWVRAADVRRIVGHTASDGALALTYPDGWRLLGTPAEPHFSDEALLAHLAKEPLPRALKFRHWVEREIAFPARRVRERYGVRPEVE